MGLILAAFAVWLLFSWGLTVASGRLMRTGHPNLSMALCVLMAAFWALCFIALFRMGSGGSRVADGAVDRVVHPQEMGVEDGKR